nr:MAG TPA: hypothetical protein [Caudoviricetes sp.]
MLFWCVCKIYLCVCKIFIMLYIFIYVLNKNLLPHPP